MTVQPLARPLWDPIIRRDLEIDLGSAGDLTTDATIPADTMTTAAVVARAEGRISGLEFATEAFVMLDDRVAVDLIVSDGADAAAGTTIATISGPARAILTAERTALNLLGHLSGIATVTRNVVRLVEGTGASVAETRKTTPGLRVLEKYAVRCGGGSNHRFGLDDAVMIKDNHIAVAGSIPDALAAVKSSVGHTVTIEIEVDDLGQLEEVLEHGADVILLDNMSTDELRQAVAMINGRATAEASGGITPETARSIAETGVDVLSMGWLTHSAPNLDVALDIAL
jgi:nicotinate-nucleotide pyrophosphorylase (carboxylating)